MKKLIVSLLCVVVFSFSSCTVIQYSDDGWKFFTHEAEATMVGDPQGDIANVSPDGHLDVMVGDQTSPPVIVHLNRTTNETTLTTVAVVDATTIVVAAATGFVDGAHITLVSAAGDRYSTFHQVGAIATLTVTIDTPLDFAYDVATTLVSVGSHDLTSVVGSLAAPITYSLRAADVTPGIPTTVDITRLIFTCTDDVVVDFTKFCGISTLTNGIVLRRVDGSTQNIFNAKSNIDLANIMFDFTVIAALNPVQGIDGFVGRLTFSGQNKMGVAIRLGPGEDLELLIQDDLTAITSFVVIAEGHVVVPD